MNELAPLHHIIQKIVQSQSREAGKLKAILDSIGDGVIVQDEAGRIEMMNPSARQIFDTLGGNLSPMPQDQADLERRQAQVEARQASLLSYLTGLEYHQPQNIEIERRILNALAAPVIRPDGRRAGAVFVIRDVTSEAEARKLKDDFITSISHELRTPLAAIKGYNDLLRMRIGDVKAEQQAAFLTSLDGSDKNLSDLLTLIEHTLDLTQIEAGVFWLNEERIDLVAVIRAAAEAWQAPMAAKTLTYQLDFPAGPVWSRGDESRLNRVMTYLLNNAHSYTPSGGRVEVSLTHEPDWLQVNIKDSGVGIAERDQPFIFERFFRAIHAEDTYEVSGSGLGLFMSRTIIEAHGGKIWFESQINVGSTFSFCLPIVAAKDSHS
jgi:PAS domain S-box-containing protein